MHCRHAFERDYLADAGLSRADLLTRDEALVLRKSLTGWLVYILWFSAPGRLFPMYVGIGSKRRPFAHSCPTEQVGNGIKRGLLRRCAAEGGTILFTIVTTNPDRQVVQDEERRLIALFGRRMLGTGPLANLTEGGEGVSDAPRLRGAAHPRARPVYVDGGLFPCTVAATAATGLSVAAIGYRIRAGWPGYRYADEQPRRNRKGRKSGAAHPVSRAVYADNKRYETMTAAAGALGCHTTAIFARIDRGWPGYYYEDEGQKPQSKPHRKYPVTIHGTTYPSITAAAQALGIPFPTVQWRLAHRTPGYTSPNPAYQA